VACAAKSITGAVPAFEQVVEGLATGGALQPVDATETAIVQQHNRQLQSQHHRRGELRVQHEIAAVADHHDDLALRPRQLHAKSAGDFVAHAGIAVFEMIGPDLLRLPKLVQLARQAAGGADHNGILWRDALHCADDLRIRRQRGVGWRGDRLRFGAPCGHRGARLVLPFGWCAITGQRRVQCGEAFPRIGDQRQHVALAGVEGLHVERDEYACRILEQSP
jgi:hypothetical protein